MYQGVVDSKIVTIECTVDIWNKDCRERETVGLRT